MTDKTQRAHAILAPSKAERWMLCAGSALAEEAEENPPNEWSAEGSLAHDVLYRSLHFGLEPGDFYGQRRKIDGFEVKVDDEMVDELEGVVDRLRDIGGEQFYEIRVDLGRWLPDQFGTSDFAAIHVKEFLIDVSDLKYGRGLVVRAENNIQCKIYGLGIWDNIAKHFFDKRDYHKVRFRFTIEQPRNDGGGGEEIVTYEEMMEFAEEVERAGRKALKPNAKRTPGDDQCAYCLAAINGHCREYDAFNLAKFGAKFDDLEEKELPELTDPDKLTPEQRAVILRGADGLRQWLNRIKADHMNELLRGGEGGGLKAVAGRKGRREWEDEDAAHQFMDEHEIPERKRFKPREVISPTGAEALVGKSKKVRDQLAKYITQADGKPALVPEDDPRPAIEAYAERFTDSDFDDD